MAVTRATWEISAGCADHSFLQSGSIVTLQKVKASMISVVFNGLQHFFGAETTLQIAVKVFTLKNSLVEA